MTLGEEFQRFFTQSDLEISYPLLFKNLQREPRDKSDIIREFDSEKYSSVLEEKLFSNPSAKQVEKNSLNDQVFFDGLNFKNGSKSEMLDAYFSRISLASELFFSGVENVIDLAWGEWAIEWFRYNRYSDLWFEQLNRILINNHKYKLTKIRRNMFAHNPLLPVSMVIVERRESLNDSR